jgi:hypothetical protein
MANNLFLMNLHNPYLLRGRRGRDCMVDGITTACATSACRH